MSSSEHSSMASSSRSRSGRRRNNVTVTAVFPMIRSLAAEYHPFFVATGIAIELLQAISFAINPRVAGHVSTWSILYITQLPYWDGMYATGTTFAKSFMAMYWVVSIPAWMFLFFTVLGISFSHFVAASIIRPFLRHAVHLYLGVMFVPLIQGLLVTMSCTEVPYAVWLFQEQSCADSVVVAMKGISIALIILFSSLALSIAACSFPAEIHNKSIKRRAHPYVDLANLIYRMGVCISFQLLVPRGMTSYYSFIVAIASVALSALYAFVLPFTSKWMNSLYTVAYALAAWCATVVYIDAKFDVVNFVGQGGFFAVLILGGPCVAVAAFLLSRVRYSPQTAHLLSRCTKTGFVPQDENPFCIAAKNSNPELLPFPSGLPTSDFVFSPHRFVETDVIEEALRNEDGGESSSQGDGSRANDDESQAAVRMRKYLQRVQVVSPTISVAWLATDAEVSSRFMLDWIQITDSPPTPHMLSFSCRMFAKFLLKFPQSPTASIAYVRFLTEHCPSLSRMNLSVKLLDGLPNEMVCDLHHVYQTYNLTLSVKEVLGVRDRNHEKMYRKSRKLHRETLIQTASLWRSLLEEDRNLVSLCFLAHSLSDIREECIGNYLQAMSASSDDEVLFRSFANFIDNVTMDAQTATLCLEEAEAIGRRRRAKLLQRVESGAAVMATGGDSAVGQQSQSRSSVSRMHRGEDDAAIAYRGIISSVKEATLSLAQNLNTRLFYYTMIFVFGLFTAIIAAYAAVVLVQFVTWTSETSRTYYSGDLLSRSQEIVVQLYRLASVLPVDNISSYSTDDVTLHSNKLLAYTYAFEASVNYMTAGAGKETDSEFVKWIKAPTVLLNSYDSPIFFDVTPFNYWTASDTLVQFLTRIASFALTNPTQSDFLANTDVLFVFGNVPQIYSSMYQSAVTQQLNAQDRKVQKESVAYGVAMAVFAIMIFGGAYLFVWNFRRSASSKVQTLKLFLMIPTDTVKRIASEAKARVEKFVSGEQMSKEEHGSSGASNLAASLNGSGLDFPKESSGGGSGGGGGDFEDDDMTRRTSYTSKLLAHLFQRGVDTFEVDPVSLKDGEGAAGSAAADADNAAAHNVVLLGADIGDTVGAQSSSGAEGASTAAAQAAAKATGGGITPNQGSAITPLQVGFLAVEDAKLRDRAGSFSDEKKKRHSISIGSAMKGMGVQPKHRGSILEMVESSMISEDDPIADAVEAEISTGGASNTQSQDDDELEKNSIARKSGLTLPIVTLLFVATVAAVVGLALSAQCPSDTKLSDQRMSSLKDEVACADGIRDLSLDLFFLSQRFVASGRYEDYQLVNAKYKAFGSTRRQCANTLPNLKDVDATMYTRMLTRLQQAIEIAISLRAQDLTDVERILFSGLQWEAPPKTFARLDLYEAQVPNIDDDWFSYTSNAVDSALPSANRQQLAERVLYDALGQGVFMNYLDSQSALAAAISDSIVAEADKIQSTLLANSGVSIAAWGVCFVTCIAFLVYWTGSTFVRRSVILLAVLSIGGLAAGIGHTAFVVKRHDAVVTYASDRLTKAILREHLGKQLFFGYSATFVPSDATLYNYLAITAPIQLSNFQGAVILQDAFSSANPAAVDSTLTFITERGDVNRMMLVAAKLTLSARVSTIFNAEPRMSSVQWNRTAEPNDPYLTLKFPSDDALMYTNNPTDLSMNQTAKMTLAANILSTQRLSYFTGVMLTTVDSVMSQVTAFQTSQSTQHDSAFYGSQDAFVAMSAAGLFAYVVLMIAIGVALINSFSETKLESDMYSALYSTYSYIITGSLGLVAAAIIAVGIIAIVFTKESADNQKVLFAAMDRSFLAANAMNYAERMFVASNGNDRIVARLALQDVVDSLASVAQDVYFTSSSAFRLRSSQNTALFGPELGLSVRNVEDNLLSSTSLLSSSSCFDPANSNNGNQQSVSILYAQFVDLIRQMAYADSLGFVDQGSNPTILYDMIARARAQYDTLMDVLHTSDKAFKSDILSNHDTYTYIIVAILIAAFVLLMIVLATTVLPVVRIMEAHELGTKLLLALLPQDVRTQIPEIADFFDADAGTKDDQLKKKLLQSEKLLQNILPPVISRRLKNGERVIADTHPNVTVVFAALIGFDEYSVKMEGKQIVHFLNSLIVTFDQITDILELEKIKTIGDIYFLCGGLTKKTESDHPVRCMDCALLFQEAIAEHNQRHNTPNLTLRIGINTDPAVAGVIGSKKVAYDLWGDSVNTASRMQSTGLPGKIQVSDKTYHLIKEFYSFTERKVAAKGKGELTTHIYANRLKPTPYRNTNWRISSR